MQKGERLGCGQTAEIFAWDAGEVIKLFLSNRSMAQAAYEARVARVIHASGVPSPTVGALVEVDGRAGIIYERIEGPSLLALPQAQPQRIVHVAHTLAEVHAALHQRAVPELPSLHQRLERQIRAAHPLSVALQDGAIATLAALPDGATLCHGDLHPGNILMSSRGPLVIDWENATSGHPLADVARTSLLLRMAYLHLPNTTIRQVGRVLLLLLHALYLRRYLHLTGRAQHELARWEYSGPIVKHTRLTSYPCVFDPPSPKTLYNFSSPVASGCGSSK